MNANQTQVEQLPRGITCKPLATGGYSIRWRDPLTHKQIEKRLSVELKAALVWARKQHALNQKARERRQAQEVAAFAQGVPLQAITAPVRHSISDECQRYYTALAKPENRSKSTLLHAEDSLFRFLHWCAAHELVYLDQLTGPLLQSYSDHLHALRKRNGKHYKVSSVNQWMKYPRCMLRVAAGKDRLPLNYDKIRENLKHTKIAKASDKKLHGLSTARALRPNEIKALLLAALKYDARDRTQDKLTSLGLQRARPLAPDIAMLLLSGLRRREYTFLTCAQAVYSQPDKAMLIDMPALLTVERQGRQITYPIGKKLSERLVFFRGVSHIGSQLLLELVKDRDGSEWLSMYSYHHLADALKKSLRAFGAPKCTAHDLRATCATFQLSILGLDLHRATKRLGHTETIAKESYLQPVPGQPFGVATLEKAMGCEREFKLVLKAMQAASKYERMEHRPKPSAPNTQALLTTSALHLRDTLAKWADKQGIGTSAK